MKVNDTVFQNYGGLHRYGKVKEIKENLQKVMVGLGLRLIGLMMRNL